MVSIRAFGSRSLAFAFCSLALVLFEDRFQTRPSATALGFVACLLPFWLSLWPGTTRAALLPRAGLLFLLTCLWSNLHAGESLLAVLGMAALAVGSSVERRLLRADTDLEQSRYLLLVAATLGLLACPTLLPGMRDWSLAIQPQLATGNKEWRPTYTMLENGFTPSFVLIGLGPTLLLAVYVFEQVQRVRALPVAQRKQLLPIGEWLLCGGMFVLSQQAVRNAFLCLVPLAFSLRRAAPAMTTRMARLTNLGAVCLLLAAFDDHVLQGYGSIENALALVQRDLAPNTFPEQMSQFMRDAGIEGGILNDGRWGGYLIWQRWPANHVFVDTRHDLTTEMWPVFMAAHSPGSRPRAMRQAFDRWGVELSAFRGPTFPAVHPDAAWQLLYKAGDQELYQNTAGRHAAQNMDRAQRWLSARAPRAHADLTSLAVQVGSQQWLAAPYQRHRARQATALLASNLLVDRMEGLRISATLLFDAGSYAEAREPLRQLLARDPHDTRALYQALLCAVALRDRTSARSLLTELSQRSHVLSPQQRGRLAAIGSTD